MLSVLGTILTGVLSSLIASYIAEYIHHKLDSQSENIEPNNFTILEEASRISTEHENSNLPNNPSILVSTHRLIIYAMSYFFVFLSAYLPLQLSHSNFSISTPVNNIGSPLLIILLSTVLYIPIFFASRGIVNCLVPIIKKYTFVNTVKYYSYIAIIMLFIDFFIGSNIYWLLNTDSITWFRAVYRGFIVWLAFNFLILVLPKNR